MSNVYTDNTFKMVEEATTIPEKTDSSGYNPGDKNKKFVCNPNLYGMSQSNHLYQDIESPLKSSCSAYIP